MKDSELHEGEARLRADIEQIADQLCVAVDGDFSLFVASQSNDESVQKLAMLINFLADAAHRAVTRVEEQNDRLQELDKAKSRFFATVSHELRTPLTLILGPVSEALRASTHPPDTARVLERVQRNGLRLYNLVNDILDFSKAEAGKTSICREPVDIAQALSDLIDDMEPLATCREIELRFQCELASLTVSMDPGKFEKIILNLVSNALKFTPAGGHVEVALTVNNATLQVTVSDDGIGISPDDQARLFVQFAQVDSSSTRRHEGTGLGLALVKHFAEALGGAVTLDSEVGRGSTFGVELPILACAAQPTAPSPSGDPLDPALGGRGWQVAASQKDSSLGEEAGEAGRALHSTTPNASRPRVLVADDTPDMRAYIVETLQAHFEVDAVGDGLEAWRALQARTYDVVVSDVMMPELDGIQLTHRIKGMPHLASTPVILVTARGGSEAVASGLDTGADDYLTKPFAPDELRARTKAAARMSALQTELRDKSHAAGMATVASGVLHNLGNMLNGVCVSTGLIDERLRGSGVANVTKLAAMMEAQSDDLPRFFEQDPRGKKLPAFLSAVGDSLVEEHAAMKGELAQLRKKLEEVTGMVMQYQSLVSEAEGAAETVSSHELLGCALRHCAARKAAGDLIIEVTTEDVPIYVADKHKLLQIVINLIANACQALRASPHAERRLSLSVERLEQAVQITVADNGVGIAPDAQARLFSQGFTTREGGLGLGLHMSANFAGELGGSLSFHSDGPGCGARFCLELPLQHQSQAA